MHRSAPARPAITRPALAMLTAAALAGCGGGPDLLLLPADGGDLAPVSPAALEEVVGPDAVADLGDVRSAAVIDRAPVEVPEGCADPDWTGPAVDAPVVALPDLGYTLVRTGPTEAGEATVVCDLDADGDLVVADDLTTTGTDRPVGNDYATRAGAIAGRVDVGVPDRAVVAIQRFDGWSLLIPLDPEIAVLRLHAEEGGDPEAGYDVGTVTFLTADGEDVTEASIPIPDVIHGVPRSRGSSVDDD